MVKVRIVIHNRRSVDVQLGLEPEGHALKLSRAEAMEVDLAVDRDSSPIELEIEDELVSVHFDGAKTPSKPLPDGADGK